MKILDCSNVSAKKNVKTGKRVGIVDKGLARSDSCIGSL